MRILLTIDISWSDMSRNAVIINIFLHGFSDSMFLRHNVARFSQFDKCGRRGGHNREPSRRISNGGLVHHRDRRTALLLYTKGT